MLLKKIIQQQNFLLFFDYLFLILGLLFLAFGIMFFFAYNWDKLPNIIKLGIIEIIILTTLIALYKSKGAISKLLILLLSFLIGIFLALIGQIYQMGADNWELFFYWTISITPIAIFSHFSLMWIFILVLLNISLALYGSIFNFYIFKASLVMVVFNILFFILYEYISRRKSYLKEFYALKIIGVDALFFITIYFIYNLFNKDINLSSVLIYIIFAGYLFYLYKIKKIDIFMLSILSFSIIVVGGAILLKIFSPNNFNTFLITTFTIGTYFIIASYIVYRWLRGLKNDS